MIVILMNWFNIATGKKVKLFKHKYIMKSYMLYRVVEILLPTYNLFGDL